jgi:hypothetical protein
LILRKNIYGKEKGGEVMNTKSIDFSIDERRNVDKATKNLEEKFDFSIIGDGTDDPVDLGFGIGVNPTIFSGESKKENNPPTSLDHSKQVVEDQAKTKNDKVLPLKRDLEESVEAHLTEDIKSTLSTVPDNALNVATTEQPTSDEYREKIKKSIKMFEEVKNYLRSLELKSIRNEVGNADSSKWKPSLTIVEEANISIPDSDFYIEREENSNKRSEGLIIVRETNNDLSKKKFYTFIAVPMKGIFKVLYYHGLRNVISFFGKLLIWGLVSLVATVGIYVVMAHYSDLDQTAMEMATQHYEAVKKVIVSFYEDISTSIKGKAEP